MKNTKLLVLTAMSALILVGCNSSKKADPTPSTDTGKVVDVTTEEGKATLKSKLNSTIDAYKNLKLDSASLKATAGLNAGVKFDATLDGTGDIKLDANLKDFGAEAEVKVVKQAKGEGEEYDSLNASLVAKTTSGSLSLKGSLPGIVDEGQEEAQPAPIDASLSLKGAEAGAYIYGDKLYLNIANDGNEALVKGVDTFANTLMGQLNESIFGPLVSYLLSSSEDIGQIYDFEESKFIIADLYKEMAENVYLDLGKKVEFPTIEQDEEIKGVDEAIESIVELAKQKIGFQFKTFKDDSYGFELAMDKASLLTLIALNGEEAQETVQQVDKYVSKFSVNANIHFSKDFLLESAGTSFAVEGSLDKTILGDYSEAFSSFKTDLSLSGNVQAEAKYNGVTINFPSFEDYKEVKLFND